MQHGSNEIKSYTRNCFSIGNLFDNLWKIGCCKSKRRIRYKTSNIFNSDEDFKWVGLGVLFPSKKINNNYRI